MSFDDAPEGIDIPTQSTEKTQVVVDGVAVIKESEKVEEVHLPKPTKDSGDFETEKKKLFKQETEHNNPKKPYSTIDIPDTGKIGEKFKIKLSKKTPNMQLAFGDDIVWKREDRYNPKAPKKVTLKPTILLDFHRQNFNKDVIEIELGEIRQVNGNDTQMWLAGDYMIEVRVFGIGADDESSAKKMVKISG